MNEQERAEMWALEKELAELEAENRKLRAEVDRLSKNTPRKD